MAVCYELGVGVKKNGFMAYNKYNEAANYGNDQGNNK